ncbi:MAG: hypothetical protein H6861_00465 [Rhodospirillales bacterium]|nr:hypothetical protein [Rhodospirillales bacterium]
MIGFFRTKTSKNVYIQALNALKPTLKDSGDGSWARASELVPTCEIICKTLPKDIEQLEKQEFLFATFENASSGTQEVVEHLRGWHVMGNAPSLAAMMAVSCEKFDIDQPDDVQTLMMAALLGEVENDLPYHNNLHFKKVVLQTIRMIAVHNDIFAGTSKAFGSEQITLLLTAACIHDLDHDGLGNMIKGNFYQGRLERRAHEITAPYLRATGMDEKNIRLLKSLLLSTDVSPLGNVANPMNQMKAAYRFHFKGEKEKYNTLHLDEDLEVFELDSMAAQMACLLQEADIATSGGLDYAVTQYETARIYEEIKLYEARPHHVLDFLDKVCQRCFLTDAGQKLFGANMARICALAEEDLKNGDEPYPKAQHTDFILGTVSAQTDPTRLN